MLTFFDDGIRIFDGGEYTLIGFLSKVELVKGAESLCTLLDKILLLSSYIFSFFSRFTFFEEDRSIESEVFTFYFSALTWSLMALFSFGCCGKLVTYYWDRL